MMKSKILKYSIIYLLIILFLGSICLSFLFGVKIGLLRKDPLFSKVIEVYNLSQNFKLEINKIFNKKRIQAVSNSLDYKDKKNNFKLKNNLEIFNGSVPNQFIILTSLSVWEDDEVKHKLVFISDKEIIHEINLQEIQTVSKNNDIYKWPHGLIIDDEHFIYYNFDGGNSITKKDICGKTIWTAEGNFHHLMSLNDEFIWALRKKRFGDYDIAEEFVKINKFSGNVVYSFNVRDIIVANQPYDYFSIKQRDLSSLWEYEPFHFNDIDVLTEEFSDYFESFKQGDLMISSRSLNSIYIIDQNTLKIKKILFGLTRRQHDPDWNKGYISIYDNQTEWKDGKRYEKSRIVKVLGALEQNLETLKFDVDFISDARGNHEILEIDNLKYTLITSPYEGKLLLFKNEKNIFTLFNKQKSDVLPISNGKILNKENFQYSLNLCK